MNNIATGCPSLRVLTAFVTGQLAESQAEEFTTHLVNCSACQTTVDELTPQSDSLVNALRNSQPVSSRESAQLERLMNAAVTQETLPPANSETTRTRPKRDLVSLEEFSEGLLRSGIIEGTTVDDLRDDMQPADARAFARALIESGQLTRFQAQAILQGRHQHLVLGNYVVLEPLGQGGMGRVFKAKHRQLKRIVCLKVLHAADRKSPQLVERFRREAKTVAALSHVNIVVAHDWSEADGVQFLAMEFIDGKDLAQHVEAHGSFQPCDAAQIILQSARALEYAHSRGVIHRDVKPSNILLASEERDSTGEAPLVKILDLGLARFDSLLGDSPDAFTHTSMTSTGVVMGTVDYMSPEQALNSRKADHRSDVYSLGCTLYFLITGRVAYAGETLMEKLIAHREQAVPSLIEAGAEAPAALDAILQKMLAKAPDDRYPSMTAVAEDLQLFLAGEMPLAMRLGRSPVIVDAPPLPDTRNLRHKQAWAMGICTIAMILVMVAGGWMVANTDWERALAPVVPRADSEQRQPASLADDNQPAPTIVGHPETLANGGRGRALLVVPNQWFYEDHYANTTAAFAEHEITVQVASSANSDAKPKHGKIDPVAVDMTLDEFDPDDFDAVVFLGGNVSEYTHKNDVVGKHAKAVIESSLEKGRVVAGVGNGWDAVRDTGLCHECQFETTGSIRRGKPKDGRPGIFLTAQHSTAVSEVVAAMLAELKSADP